ELRPGVPDGLDPLLRRLLAENPAERHDTAEELARALRGEPAAAKALELVACQACGARLRTGLRLCLSCGQAMGQFSLAPSPSNGWGIELVKAREDAAYMEPLRELLVTFSAEPLPPLNFVTEDVRMYSKAELKRMIRMPARLYDGLSEETAAELERRLKDKKL